MNRSMYEVNLWRSQRWDYF